MTEQTDLQQVKELGQHVDIMVYDQLLTDNDIDYLVNDFDFMYDSHFNYQRSVKNAK